MSRLDKPQRAFILSRSTLQDGNVRFVVDVVVGDDHTQHNVSLEELTGFVSEEQLNDFENELFACQEAAEEARTVPRRTVEGGNRRPAVNRKIDNPQYLRESSEATPAVDLKRPDSVTEVAARSRRHPDITTAPVISHTSVRAGRPNGHPGNHKEATGPSPDKMSRQEVNDELRRIGLGRHVQHRHFRVTKQAAHTKRSERSGETTIIIMDSSSNGIGGEQKYPKSLRKGVKPDDKSLEAFGTTETSVRGAKEPGRANDLSSPTTIRRQRFSASRRTSPSAGNNNNINGDAVLRQFQDDSNDSKWLIEKVLAHRTVQMANRSVRQYWIKWSGRPETENTWESEEDLKFADTVLKDYRASTAVRSMRAKTKPPILPIIIDLEDSEG
ncbi:MAG: hypothetical protein M1830_001196 [Pleopsidium flavum]|nr:MAG: hypothetical protein M1830_001196 [Pleopsidium flavum]